MPIIVVYACDFTINGSFQGLPRKSQGHLTVSFRMDGEGYFGRGLETLRKTLSYASLGRQQTDKPMAILSFTEESNLSRTLLIWGS